MALDLTLSGFCPDSGLVAKLKIGNVIVSGMEKTALPQKANAKYFSCMVISKPDGSQLKKSRGVCDFVAVQGSSPELCAWAANSKADLLLQPFSAERNFIDSQTAGLMAGNKVFAGILFSQFLKSGGYQRQMFLKNAMQCIRVLENAGVKMLFFSGAENEFQLRAPEDFSSFGVLLGMKTENALKCVRANPALFLGRLK